MSTQSHDDKLELPPTSLPEPVEPKGPWIKITNVNSSLSAILSIIAVATAFTVWVSHVQAQGAEEERTTTFRATTIKDIRQLQDKIGTWERFQNHTTRSLDRIMYKLGVHDPVEDTQP